MSRISSWLRFFRVVNLPTVPGDVLVGASAVAAFTPGEPSVRSIAAAAVAACGLYLWGLADNDIVGAATDGPERPLPAGELSLASARIARALCLLAVIAAGLWGGLGRVWWIGALVLFALMVTYNRSKGCFAMGLCRGASIACGGVACAPLGRTAGWVLFALSLVWVLYIAFVTKYSEGEGADPIRRATVGYLIGALVYLQLMALVVMYLITPTATTRGLLLCGAGLLLSLRVLRRALPKVSAS